MHILVIMAIPFALEAFDCVFGQDWSIERRKSALAEAYAGRVEEVNEAYNRDVDGVLVSPPFRGGNRIELFDKLSERNQRRVFILGRNHYLAIRSLGRRYLECLESLDG